MKKPRDRADLPAGGEDVSGSQPKTPQEVSYEFGWSGPLPPPATLQAFDQLVDRGAERIFAQFETEAEHRRVLESTTVAQDGLERRIAQILAGLFAFCALGVAAYAISHGAYTTAGIIGGGTIAMVVAAFLGSKVLER